MKLRGQDLWGFTKLTLKDFLNTMNKFSFFWIFQKVTLGAATLVPDEVSLLWPAEATGRCLPL